MKPPPTALWSEAPICPAKTAERLRRDVAEPHRPPSGLRFVLVDEYHDINGVDMNSSARPRGARCRPRKTASR
ncbi:MAG: hypothetical protein ROZ37_07305 [Aromatoleum sp.]|uniref:hypothetical protein n=1 Tax=Aromatoleum sp. TaxID=2307007 RepID=UPI002895D0AF|nr:hypothetical protein [Aromatoleum sp.]MDT3670126.1 hypothetical protein [Aromatoleum sp.]